MAAFPAYRAEDVLEMPLCRFKAMLGALASELGTEGSTTPVRAVAEAERIVEARRGRGLDRKPLRSLR